MLQLVSLFLLTLAAGASAQASPKSVEECIAEVDQVPAAKPRDIRIADCMLASAREESAQGNAPKARRFEIVKPTAVQIGKVRREMKNHLHDPFSAVLDDLYSIKYEGLTDLTVCGTVNGKNLMGAYGGKKPFAYFDDGKDKAFYVTDGSPGAEVMIGAFCKK